ncbi:MAG: hypothetical protein JKX70_01655 [Phycisphaerales bacterium]|nr:hypothetical protein [Phycisphaerales bacterium]
MPIQKHPFTQVFTCHECGYDMHDRIKGDPCPECNTALDTRRDDPVAVYKSRVGLAWVVASLLLLPFIGLISLLFVGLAQYKYLQHHSLTATYRASYATRKRRKLIKRLFLLWIGEALLLLLIARYWPPLFPLWSPF